jgi:hypothetical protein
VHIRTIRTAESATQSCSSRKLLILTVIIIKILEVASQSSMIYVRMLKTYKLHMENLENLNSDRKKHKPCSTRTVQVLRLCDMAFLFFITRNVYLYFLKWISHKIETNKSLSRCVCQGTFFLAEAGTSALFKEKGGLAKSTYCHTTDKKTIDFLLL